MKSANTFIVLLLLVGLASLVSAKPYFNSHERHQRPYTSGSSSINELDHDRWELKRRDIATMLENDLDEEQRELLQNRYSRLMGYGRRHGWGYQNQN